MSHIFRLHKEGDSTINDWGNSQKYGSQVIEKIEDPNGESSAREITSIPSPFARIDLVKTAYAKVVEMSKKTKSLNGDTIHHKMVSDSLDVGQLFFEFDKHRDKLQILVWDKKKDLEALQQSDNPAHQLLGETYRIYMQQDGDVYNFPLMDRMYLLNFTKSEYDTAEVNIIGATSPATLFFTSANNLNYLTRNIQFSNDNPDRPFDDDFCPLHKRDIEYIKFLWALKASIPNFSTLFKDVDAYMTASFLLMDKKKKDILQDVTIANLDDFSDISVDDNAGHSVEVLKNVKLKQNKVDVRNIEKESGFVINSDKNPFDGHKPLVLPVDVYTQPTVYTKTNRWNKDTKVPFKDEQSDLSRRILPDEGSLYPYFTISDFLTDTIVRLPYEINRESYFDGNIDRAGGKGYLLPLTDLFFRCFTTEQLCGVLNDGKKMFELKNNAGGVTVILRIPIKNNKHIEYRRTYFEGITPNTEANDGALIDKIFGLGIMPLVKFPDKVKKHYRIALFDQDTQSTGARDVKLTCCSETEFFSEQAYCMRDKKVIETGISSIEAYAINENFDRLNVQVGNTRCVLVPKFVTQRTGANKKFTFAVDFGTTNTHIEYTMDGSNPETFNMLENEKQLHHLHGSIFGSKGEMEGSLLHNFIPDKIADDTQYTFPIRTAFTEWQSINYDTNPFALVEGNIPFIYEKVPYQEVYLKLNTDLKWGGVPEKLVRLYLENLFLLMRNKVVLNGGNLENTKIIWFYPASMDEGRVIKFNKIWNDLYKIYFGTDPKENVISISESSAPYHYYRKKKGAKSEVITIDIGGGTTDVYVVENTSPKMLLSFRFASEAVFGDAHIWDSDNNGFVKLYKERFAKILKENKLQTLSKVLAQIEKRSSSDIIAFFFSLATNKEVKGNEALNFMEQLSANERLRYVFIVFYGAILYFIAKVMKIKGLKKPLTLAFSGNGSKTLTALSDSSDMVARFAKMIFDGVYGDDSGKISVIMEEAPKKATCKGGILMTEKQEYDKIAGLKHTFTGDNFNNYTGKKIKYSEINDKLKANVVKQVSEFVEFLFKLHENNNDFFTNKLIADPSVLKSVKEICSDKTDLEQSLNNEIEWKLKTLDDESSTVSETLFFYPLIGILHEVARQISEL